MSELRDWTITVPFSVPTGDEDGNFTEALLDAAVTLAPDNACGIVARADTEQGKVWIVLTVTDTTKAAARDAGRALRERVTLAVLSGEEVCITAS